MAAVEEMEADAAEEGEVAEGTDSNSAVEADSR